MPDVETQLGGVAEGAMGGISSGMMGAGALGMLREFKETLNAVMTNPLITGVALSRFGAMWQQHYISKMRESVQLTREQEKELGKLVSQTKLVNGLAGAVAGFAMKMASATVEMRKMGIEISGISRLSDMPGGQSATGAAQRITGMRAANILGMNAAAAEEWQKQFVGNYGVLQSRGATEAQIGNFAKIAALYARSGRGNMGGTVQGLLSQWGTQLSKEQATGMYEQLIQRENDRTKGRIGFAAPGQNIETFFNIMHTLGAQGGVSDVGRAHQMAMGIMAGTAAVGAGPTQQQQLGAVAANLVGSWQNQAAMSKITGLDVQGRINSAGTGGGLEALRMTQQAIHGITGRGYGDQGQIMQMSELSKEQQGRLVALARAMGVTDVQTMLQIHNMKELSKTTEEANLNLKKLGEEGEGTLAGRLNSVSAPLKKQEESIRHITDLVSYVGVKGEEYMSKVGEWANRDLGISPLGMELGAIMMGGVGMFAGRHAPGKFFRGITGMPGRGGAAAEITGGKFVPWGQAMPMSIGKGGGVGGGRWWNKPGISTASSMATAMLAGQAFGASGQEGALGTENLLRGGAETAAMFAGPIGLAMAAGGRVLSGVTAEAANLFSREPTMAGWSQEDKDKYNAKYGFGSLFMQGVTGTASKTLAPGQGAGANQAVVTVQFVSESGKPVGQTTLAMGTQAHLMISAGSVLDAYGSNIG